jgi:formylglycine-generating enzyme required for sulfatase activity
VAIWNAVLVTHRLSAMPAARSGERPVFRMLAALAALAFLAAGGPAAQAQPAFAPGLTLKDCAECPEMAVVPAGEFLMGAARGEKEAQRPETPQHRVAIARPFAIGKFEVTFEQWDACVRAGGCGHRPGDEGWGRGRRPVIHVSWRDAKEYVAWLSQKTGKTYRLPSESEWEYAARAGTATARYWGDSADEGCAHANLADLTVREIYKQWTVANCRDGYAFTSPAGSFAANAFGLHDMLGNVMEWVEDCWRPGYKNAPNDGGAWTADGCADRVLRGGAWDDRPRDGRSASRYRNDADERTYHYGIRVVREP